VFQSRTPQTLPASRHRLLLVVGHLELTHAALWKSSIWRIQLVSGFHLGKVWSTNLRSYYQQLRAH
jgi:hypothetical protein